MQNRLTITDQEIKKTSKLMKEFHTEIQDKKSLELKGKESETQKPAHCSEKTEHALQGFSKANLEQNKSTIINQESNKISQLMNEFHARNKIKQSSELKSKESEIQKSSQPSTEKKRGLSKTNLFQSGSTILDKEIKKSIKLMKEVNKKPKVKQSFDFKAKIEAQKSAQLNLEKLEQSFVKVNPIQNGLSLINKEINKSTELIKESQAETKIKESLELRSKEFETKKSAQLISEKSQSSYVKANPIQNGSTLVDKEIKKSPNLVKEFHTETKIEEPFKLKGKEFETQKSTQLTSKDDTKIEAISNKESLKCNSISNEQVIK